MLSQYSAFTIINNTECQVEKKSDLSYGAPIPDPSSGLFAPILAVTIHPFTKELLPVSGTHIHPVTNLRFDNCF